MKFYSALFLSLLFSLNLRGADWAHWLGPQGDGTTTESNWKAEIQEPLWRKKIGIGFSAVAVSGGKVFAMGHDGGKKGGKETVFCFDGLTGHSIWSHSYAAPLVDYLHEGGPCSTPVVDDSVVYSISKHGLLHAWDAKSGKILWKRDMPKEAKMKKLPYWGFAASPLIFEEQLIIEAGATYSMNKKNGSILWESDFFQAAYGSPTIFSPEGFPMIAVLKNDGLVLINPENGSTLDFVGWETSYQTNASTPIVRGDKLFLSTGYKRGCALFQWNGRKLEKQYENKNLSTHMNHAILVEDFVYGFDGNVHMAGPKDFVCMDFLTGKVQWRITDRSLEIGSLLVAGDRMMLLGQRGELVFARVNPLEFEEIFREQAIGGRCWTMPVFSQGILYLRNARGDLYAYDLGSK